MASGIGNVYYFNATPYTVTLRNNERDLATVPGIEKGASYAPSAHEVERSSADKSGNKTFGTENDFVVLPESGVGLHFPVKIETAEIPLKEDVQLYVFFNQVVLVSPAGNGKSIVINGEALSETETAELREEAAAQA